MFPAVLLLVAFAQAPIDEYWPADALLEVSQSHSIADLGAIQGVSQRDGKIYIYGDVHTVKPRVGAIREYAKDLRPTGRVVWLLRRNQPLLVHPTGLTFDKRLGTFLGDTQNKRARIYQLDWERAWKDGNLDNAVLAEIEDDAAVNGCRPEFVTLAGKRYLATADYGDVRPEIRLYDPTRLLAAKRSSAPGVAVHRILCGPYNQNLQWNDEKQQLTCIQNVIPGRGWRLDVLDLPRAVADGRSTGPGVGVHSFTIAFHDELEGMCPFDASGKLIFVTSSREQNTWIGVPRTVPRRVSQPGELGILKTKP